MAQEITAIAKGFDLSPYKTTIGTILDRAGVEVQLIRAQQVAKFDVRTIQESFTADIAAAETEDDVTQIITSVLENVNNFKQ